MLSLISCEVFDKPETVPAWVQIDEFELTTTSSEGTDREKIKDAWVYVNSNLVGVFELPCKVPIPATGTANVDVFPGIYKNGIQGDRARYPFYTGQSLTVEVEPNEIHQVSNATQYKDDLFFWVEDFEDPSIDMEPSADSDTTMFIAKPSQFNDLIEGDAGAIFMHSGQIQCQMQTDEVEFVNLPRDLTIPAYLEMDYKTNYETEVGILSKDDGVGAFTRTPLITLTPIGDWNKTYLYLPDVTNFYPTATEFQIYFRIFNRDATDNIEFFVDNLKVIFAE